MNALFDMTADDRDIILLAAIEDGIPICECPYDRIGQTIAMSEDEVISRLARMRASGIIRRFGLVMRHRPLGYKANAMVVWDIPDGLVDDAAAKIITNDFVTLCYCRARRAEVWPYNLYCMVHGREREIVEEQIKTLKQSAGLEAFPTQTLFSRRGFKQCGARFSTRITSPALAAE